MRDLLLDHHVKKVSNFIKQLPGHNTWSKSFVLVTPYPEIY